MLNTAKTLFYFVKEAVTYFDEVLLGDGRCSLALFMATVGCDTELELLGLFSSCEVLST